MTPSLNIKGTIINLDFETQTSKVGRPFRWSGIRLCVDEPAIWLNKQLTYKTIYDFKYIDKKGGFVSFKFNYNGIFEKVVVD